MGSKRSYKKKLLESEKLIRRHAVKSPQETVYIICEGRTESAYLRRLAQDLRLSSVTVNVGKGSAPISIVEQAIDLAENESDIDHIFCVFDKDEHESYERANKTLINYQTHNIDKKTKLQTITSVPCFEIWLLLHFGYSTKFYLSKRNKSGADHLLSDLQKHLPQYKKGANLDWYNHLLDKQVIALTNARRLQQHNHETQSNNPATNMHELVLFLMSRKIS